MTVLAQRALDAENDGELSTGWLPKGLWIPATAVTGWFLWAYFHLRPAGSVDSAAHPFAVYGPWSYGHLAYSDVISLYYVFHLGNHALPYVHTRVEYPVLTGIFMWLAAWAPGVQGDFLASGLGLLACALGTLYFLHRIDWRFAWSFALCPLLLVYGLLNWDLLAIFFMVTGWAQFRARRYAWAGVLLSLGVWAKFFPIVLLFYCVISLLRDPRHRVHARTMVLWSGVAALIVNAPFAVTNVGNWDHFFVFNARRGGGGGILYELHLASALPIPAVDLLSGFLVLLAVALLVHGSSAGAPPGRVRIGTFSAAVLCSPPVLFYDNLLEVRASALKHGCSTEDIRHAITNALAAYDDLDDPYVLYLGPDIAGTLLEVLAGRIGRGDRLPRHADAPQVQEAAPMTEPRKAKTGEPMDDDFWRRAEEKAHAGLDPSRLHRRVGRPTLGDEPAELTAVRLPPEVRRALDDRAAEEHTSASEVIRRALDQYLASWLVSSCSARTVDRISPG